MSDTTLVFENRALLKLSGDDVHSLLQGIITQDMDRLQDGAIYSCLLTPQGKLIADFFLVPVGDDLFLDCAASLAQSLRQKLTFYKLRAKVEIEDVTDQWAAGASWDNGDSGTAGQILNTSQTRIDYIDPRLESLGARFIVERPAAPESTGTQEDYIARCLTLGVPMADRDILPEQGFPLDLNLDALNGIDYAKGCFVGQEVSSRMKRKGEVRKRLWQFSFDGPTPAADTPIKKGETTVGEVSSTAGGLGLARVRLDRLAKAEGSCMAGETEVTLRKPDYLRDQ